VKWRSIKVNVWFSLINSLRYVTFSSVRAVFGRPIGAYLAFVPLLTHAHQPIYRLLSLSKASNPFPEILQQLCGIQYQVSTMSISLSFIDIRYFTHNQSWNIEEFSAYYTAMLHVNIEIMTSQQSWYLIVAQLL